MQMTHKSPFLLMNKLSRMDEMMYHSLVRNKCNHNHNHLGVYSGFTHLYKIVIQQSLMESEKEMKRRESTKRDCYGDHEASIKFISTESGSVMIQSHSTSSGL